MSEADGPDQPLRRSARISVTPSVTVNPRTRPTHRARSGHGGLFVPKPSHSATCQRCNMSDLGTAVRGYLLASTADSGDCYLVTRPVPSEALAPGRTTTSIRNYWRPGCSGRSAKSVDGSAPLGTAVAGPVTALWCCTPGASRLGLTACTIPY